MKILSRTAFFLFLLLLALKVNGAVVWDAQKGWQVEGGVTELIIGGTQQDARNAIDLMNQGAREAEEENYRTAIKLYKKVVDSYESSILVPEALFQIGLIQVKRENWEEAFESFDNIAKNYPQYERMGAVTAQQLDIANRVRDGARFKILWVIPGFSNRGKAIEFYETIVKNAPFTRYAPIALMNMANLAIDRNDIPVAIDALDRIISDYSDSFLAPDAYFKMAKLHQDQGGEGYYDQASTQNAINYYEDYISLFPNDKDVPEAEKQIKHLKEILAESKYIIGEFYYVNRYNIDGAKIFYNEAITVAPNSEYATKARSRLEEINTGAPLPYSPGSWLLGKPNVKKSDREIELDSKVEKRHDNTDTSPFPMFNTDE